MNNVAHLSFIVLPWTTVQAAHTAKAARIRSMVLFRRPTKVETYCMQKSIKDARQAEVSGLKLQTGAEIEGQWPQILR